VFDFFLRFPFRPFSEKHGWATALAKVYHPPRQSPSTTMNNSQHARTKYQQGITTTANKEQT